MAIPKTIDTYLREIDATYTVRDRVEVLWSITKRIIPDAPLDSAFISQRIDDEGSTRNGSLWFYSSEYVVECRDFLFATNVDGLAGDTVFYWNFVSENYDFESAATAESRLLLTWKSHQVMNGSMSAVGVNCDHLFRFFRTFASKSS